MTPPSFLITIDAEGDNAWQQAGPVQTQNARFLPRFQTLCERYGFKPTYLANYEMATDPFFIEFGRDLIERNVGEIGSHIHAWHSPPEHELTDNDALYHPYLTEYPEDVIEAKLSFMTHLLEETFQIKMTSHRGGRWALDERYARLLLKHGYTVDCSVTPGISWSSNVGAPGGKGGPDYTNFPAHAYFIDLDNISRSGNSALLEIPMTIERSPLHRMLPGCYQWKIVGPIAHRLSEPIHWFRPLGPRLETMREMIVAAARRSAPYLEFMQHSSEFMPGGSPYFPDAPSVERLFENLEALFGLVASHFSGATLREYRASFSPSASEGGSS